MFVDADGRRGLAGGVRLRECSVVVFGSRCKICGRDFKCETDVALHTRWRHTQAVACFVNRFAGERCDVCDEHLGTTSNLRVHKRQMHKKQPQDRRRGRKLRLVFKIGGVTMTEVSLSRKYLRNSDSNGYFVDIGTQTDSHESEERSQEDDCCATNIDSSLVADRVVVGNNRIQCIQPHKVATNRYIVGKFASTQCDAVARSTGGAHARSLVEISNRTNRDAICGTSDGSCEEHKDPRALDITREEENARYTTTGASFATDNANIHDKENSRRLNERENRNANLAAEDTFVLKSKSRPSEVPLNDAKVLLVRQRDKPDRTTPISKQQNYRSNESRCDPIGSSNGVISGPAKPVEIIIDNDDDERFNGAATRQSAISLVRLNESVDSSTDDDVQEVLRITRGKEQSDINHESPNLREREILVQNTIGEMYVEAAPTLVGAAYPVKDDVGFTLNNNNIDSFDCPPDTSCQFTTNMADIFLPKAFNEKLGIYLDEAHHYGIRYCSDLLEINNNSLEECAMHSQGFIEPWMLTTEPQYTSDLKPNNNEASVMID